MNEQSIPYVETHIITTEDLKYAYYRGKHDMPEQRKGETMTKRDKDFLLYLVDLAEKINDRDCDSCTFTFEKDGVVFNCEMTFEIYEKDGE